MQKELFQVFQSQEGGSPGPRALLTFSQQKSRAQPQEGSSRFILGPAKLQGCVSTEGEDCHLLTMENML